MLSRVLVNASAKACPAPAPIGAAAGQDIDVDCQILMPRSAEFMYRPQSDISALPRIIQGAKGGRAMSRIAVLISAVSLAALAGCGPMQGKRSELAEREIEQCVAGMAGLIPDDEQRKTVCECTADAKFDPQLSGEAMADVADKCREKAGLDPNDPLGILGEDGSEEQSDETTVY
jgi:hypothetical protein